MNSSDISVRLAAGGWNFILETLKWKNSVYYIEVVAEERVMWDDNAAVWC